MKNNDEIKKIIKNSIKILNLVYFVLILLLIIGFIYIGEYIGLFGIIFKIIDILMPLLIGFIIAWIFSPVVDGLEKKKINRVGASLIVFTGIIAFISVFFCLFIPVISKQLSDLINFLPSASLYISNFFEKNVFETVQMAGVNTSHFTNILGEYLQKFSSNIPSMLIGGAQEVASGLVNAVLSLILALYLLIDFDQIKKNSLKLIPIKKQKNVSSLFNEIEVEVRKTVNGIILISSIVFLCNTVGFSIIGLEAALLIGFLCGITNIIPYIGPWIGGGFAVVIGFSQGTIIGFGVLIISIIVQCLENYVIQPIVMSKTTNIHPVIIMMSLLLFGHFFGILGMILSTPILSIIKVIFSNFKKFR